MQAGSYTHTRGGSCSGTTEELTEEQRRVHGQLSAVTVSADSQQGRSPEILAALCSAVLTAYKLLLFWV